MSLSVPARRLLTGAVLVAGGFGLTAVGATPASAANCTYSAKVGRSFGPSYVTSIQQSGTSCATAKKVVKSFHACRGSKTGRCTKKVRSYRCTEKRGKTYQGQFSAKVTCTRGKARVVHTYSEFV